MPVYEYVCSECDNKFEQLRPLSQAENEANCPKCHQPAKRIMSVVAVYSMASSGIPKPVAGSGSSSCSSCSSGNCSTCAS